MIIHYQKESKILCTGDRTREGMLFSRWTSWRHYTDDKQPKFLYSTSDNIINCQDCIKKRIDHHLAIAAKLEQKILTNEVYRRR